MIDAKNKALALAEMSGALRNPTPSEWVVQDDDGWVNSEYPAAILLPNGQVVPVGGHGSDYPNFLDYQRGERWA
jgi:hypothetical protein